MKDWQGRDVPLDEPPGAVVGVWQITPEPSLRECDSYLVRGWQDMLEFVESETENSLEHMGPDAIKDGFTIRVKLVEMTRKDLDDAIEAGFDA